MQGRVYVMILFVIAMASCCCHCQDIFDTIEPIVKISPARDSQNSPNLLDQFGYSAIAHQVEEVLPDDTLEIALQKTTIVVGAPRGQFPGGITGLDYGYFACSETITGEANLMNTTQEQRAACLNYKTGLVYRCDLNTGDCGALLGNGDAESNDGSLFERSGNNPDLETATIEADSGFERKINQLMGFTIESFGGFLVVCAPLWQSLRETDTTVPGPQPRGRCLYSGRSLENFVRLLPCVRGDDLNQNIGGYCTAGIGAKFKRNSTTSPVELGLGLPGRYFSRGGFSYYADASDMTTLVQDYKLTTVPSSIGTSDIFANRKFNNLPIPLGSLGYYGFSVTSGRFVGDGTQYLVSAPRYPSDSFVGYVYLPRTLEILPKVAFKGEQFGEMFGFSMAGLDLNNDGYDDAIVSAPIYSERDFAELGRIFIFENDQGNGFLNATRINGFAANSRFGNAIAPLGDLNNDGFQDFAVSAPYEGSGVVYIYYGQARDSTGSIVNTQYAQRIDGGSFVDSVSNLTEVSSFGFTLQGDVDVDNNQYNDLVIGAYGSQTVFVLRSRPFATFTSSINSVNEVDLTVFGCQLGDAFYSCFSVTFCSSYSGKGIADEFSTTFNLRETSTPSRLQFTADPTSTSIALPITFYGENNQSCNVVTVYVRNGTTSLDSFKLSGEVFNIVRTPVVVDTSFVPSDLSAIPVISSDTANIEVLVAANCGQDDECMSELSLSLDDIVYRVVSGDLTDDQSTLIIDEVARVEISTVFSNTGEDAFNSFITFSVPKQNFNFDQASIENIRVTCDETTPLNTTHDNRRCNVRTPLSQAANPIPLVIRMSIAKLTGEEGSINIPMSIMIGPNSTRNTEADLTNNTINVNIPVSARSVFSVSGLFGSDAVTYQGNHTPSVDEEASNLGESLLLSSTFRNEGPSNIQNGTLTIYVPIRSSTTGDNYFYYPAKLSTSSANVNCTTAGINPEGYNVNSRRRRSIRRGLDRITRQTITNEMPDVDCARTPDDCLKISCSITDLGRLGVDVTITGYLDERFYNRKEQQYILRAYVVGEVLNSFVDTTGSQTSDNFTVAISVQSLASSNNRTPPWYVIAAPIAAALIFLVVLALLLYFFGFFKRRKGGKEVVAEDDEFDQFDTNPFGGRSGSARAIPGTKPPPADPELLKYEEKGKEE